ncbi:hypothetical protein [Pedobacter africanus]|uniref:Uncharacterized protein n=1 Tax=Pedobacter africanus TaxID=151894 RepID=A0A1W2BZF7_9SPHI|nr:hypothetical protein [Pedobacter africanus]SMC78375.1 hypothetical protein SAMN04488524_2779 [Pedobacter africanus]
MPSKYKYLLSIFILLCFSSCFQVIEEINLTKAGTGTVNLTLNLSASKTKVASVMLMDSIQGYKVPSKQKIQKELDEVVAYLKRSPGISNVQKKVDFENYIVSVSFAFKDIANINNVNQDVLKKLKVKGVSNSSYIYNAKNQVFQRSYQHAKDAVVQYNRLKPEVKKVFKDATYTSIYRFEQPIVSSNNPLAKVSKSKKAVMLNTGVLGLINGKTDLSNSIVLTK